MNLPMATRHAALTIVTGASSNHFLPLQSLLWTIARFEPGARVIAYDLGLSAAEHDYLTHAPPFYLEDFELRIFDFAKYPPHFSMFENAGRMAFRPTILASVARKRNSGPASGLSTINSHPPTLLWLDAGCQLREPLHEIRACVAREGVYSPCAPGTIEKCLHPASYSPLSVTDELLSLQIRDAGICGFNITNLQIVALLNRWADVALDENCTAPIGSTRHTHRQDAVFAVLLNRAAQANNWKLETRRFRGLAIKQDTLTVAETAFRVGPQ